ncbi:plasminogen activator inhibitor 1-like [Choristoneura fumiferana]|uniref:plasminogen activator inhibitor 1-like n=1 Tax=Choristoneura fumiferana TaxID=7141 RepID=UPI003D157D84
MDWGSRVALILMLFSVTISGENDSTDSSTTENNPDHDHLAFAVNELGYKLMMETMKQNTDSNIVISPTGIAGLLAMTLLGSAGRTYDELATALGFSQDILTNRANHENFGELLAGLNSNASSQTLYADAIFVDARAQLRALFREYLKRVYRGDALVTSFSDSGHAKDTINEWIKNNTNGRIEDFLKEPLPTQTKVVLLCALYFSGQWKHPFIPEYTVKMPFRSPGGDVMADLMLNFGQFKYIFSVNDGLHMIALPYNDSTTTMYVLKPRFPKRTSLPELMSRLNCSRINQLINQMETNKAVIRFPKIDIKSSMNLEESLKALGLTSMFSPREANFALMVKSEKEVDAKENDLIAKIRSGDRPKEIKDEVNSLPNPGVYVETVLHDVKIAINEYGTEAVAATSGILARSAEQFYADSPFYMFIRNEKTMLVTFSAVIFNPTV